MNKVYDLIIIGSGPAGLTAGIYAKRAELDFIVIEKNVMSGGQIINTYEVDNYPGFPDITGFDLAMKFREHCDKLGVIFITGEVVNFASEDDVKTIMLSSGEVYQAKSIIIATGTEHRKLNVEGEVEFTGKGVSYCATCDGAFYRDKTTVVIGGGDVAVEDAIFLARLCKKVYVVHRRDEFRAAKTLVSKLKSLENAEIIWDSVVEKIEGDSFVTNVKLKNLKTQISNDVMVDGAFVAVGTVPTADFYRDFVETDEAGYIKGNELCETSTPGIFAAGDIRSKSLKQVITAASDGANAITAVEKYIFH